MLKVSNQTFYRSISLAFILIFVAYNNCTADEATSVSETTNAQNQSAQPTQMQQPLARPMTANSQGYNIANPAPNGLNRTGMIPPPSGQQPPVWPLQNTEPGIDPRSLDDPFSGSVEKPTQPDGWSGGADLVTKESDAVRYAREEQAAAFMPLGTKDMMVDDGAKTLSASIQFGGGYGSTRSSERAIAEVELQGQGDETAEKVYGTEDVKDWIAKEGLTLREVLIEWAKIDGWEIIWNTNREYPLKASAIFRGRFKDVTAAIIRGFSKAYPPPYAKFYLGNKVIVIQTMEDDND